LTVDAVAKHRQNTRCDKLYQYAPENQLNPCSQVWSIDITVGLR